MGSSRTRTTRGDPYAPVRAGVRCGYRQGAEYGSPPADPRDSTHRLPFLREVWFLWIDAFRN
jgi:hypothetical protein